MDKQTGRVGLCGSRRWGAKSSLGAELRLPATDRRGAAAARIRNLGALQPCPAPWQAPFSAPESHNRQTTVPRPPDSPLVARTPVTSGEGLEEEGAFHEQTIGRSARTMHPRQCCAVADSKQSNRPERQATSASCPAPAGPRGFACTCCCLGHVDSGDEQAAVGAHIHNMVVGAGVQPGR